MGNLPSSFCPSKHLSLDDSDGKNTSSIASRRNMQKSTFISTYDDEIANTMHKHNLIQKSDHRIYIKKGNEIFDEHSKVHLEDFEWLNVLGEGGFGKVMLVRKKDNHHLYAMKMQEKELILRKNQKVHIMTERSVLEGVHCPFITQLHYAFQNSSKLFLIMDFVQGGELFTHMRKFKITEENARFYACEIIMALESLHKKHIIYRDLKPENILIDNLGHVKIADFGLSKQGLEDNEKTYSFCGTIDYIAPEIFQKLGHNKAVDWWSLGVLIYEMIVKIPPFYGKTRAQTFRRILNEPLNILPSFSPELASLLKGLLNINQLERLGFGKKDAEEIKSHEWFAGINWEDVKEKKITPPFQPRLKGDYDLKYFDRFFLDASMDDTQFKEEPDKFDQEFENFSYSEKSDCSSTQS